MQKKPDYTFISIPVQESLRKMVIVRGPEKALQQIVSLCMEMKTIRQSKEYQALYPQGLYLSRLSLYLSLSLSLSLPLLYLSISLSLSFSLSRFSLPPSPTVSLSLSYSLSLSLSACSSGHVAYPSFFLHKIAAEFPRGVAPTSSSERRWIQGKQSK
jgi:hypothetical protein